MSSQGKAPTGRLAGISNYESEIAGLDQELRRMSAREGLARSLVEPDVTPDVNGNVKPSLTSPRERLDSRVGSVSRPTIPRSQDFLFQSSTIFRPETTPISSPVFTGFIPSEGYERGRQVDEDESHARYDGEVEELLNPGYGQMVARLKEVQDYYSETFPKEAENGVGSMSVVGDYRNLPHSLQIQSSPSVHPSPRDEGLSGRVPDRFHTGRESLSVLQNVTKRESKRPKARSQDHDYKRRFSSSGPMPNLSTYRDAGFPLGGGNSNSTSVVSGAAFPRWADEPVSKWWTWGHRKWIQRRP